MITTNLALPLFISTTRRFTYSLLLFACICFMGFMGCNHFEGQGEFISQGEFATPEEIYNSEKILKTPDKQLPPSEVFQLNWPLKKITISRGFSDQGNRAHFGLDLTGPYGTPILAAHSGTVVYAGSKFRGFGKMVIIEYDSNWASLYAHLSKFRVKMGQVVKAGQSIGLMGRTGRASGVHLHFELMNSQLPVDPIPLLPAK